MKACLFFAFLLIASALAGCPDASGAAFPTVSAGQAVVISQDTILSASPGVVLGSLTLRAKLYIKDANIELRTGFIKVENNGYLIAGGSDCPITNKVKIILHGSSSNAAVNTIGVDYDGTAFGSKGLIVANGGSISLWGQVSGLTWTRIASTVAKGSTQLTLKDAVEWKAGDDIVITSTDYSSVLNFQDTKYGSTQWDPAKGYPFPDQNERRTITAVSADKKTLTVNAALDFTHWGSGNQFAEVGMLNRKIVITSDEGSDQDGAFGGHILMRKGPVTELSGVEVTRMGQRGVLARYPVHFHNMSDVFDTKPFIQHSSIHNNFQRCLVVHQSHGVLIKNNVAFNTSGHCYFLEDGMEHGNVFDSNLGASAHPIALEAKALLPSDNRAAIFWIVNPNNTWVNNVASGGHHGFWFAMPERPRNLALTLYGNDAYAWPRKHPLGKFDGNVAHSNRESGVHIDDMENADGTTSLADFSPMQGPYMSQWPYGGAAIEAHFTNILAYKNRDSGIWGKTSLRFSRCILEDNGRAFMVNGKTVLSDSLIVGETDNVGSSIAIWGKTYPRSTPSKWGDQKWFLEGHSSYDNGGPQFSLRNKFVNFVAREGRPAAALVPLRNGPFMLFPGTQFGHQLEFENANQFYLNYGGQDCEYGWNVLDADGKITGYPGGAWIQSNETHFLRDGCTWKAEWNAYICPHFGEGYSQVTLRGSSGAVANPEPGYDIPKTGARTIRGIFRPLGSSLNGPKGEMEGASTGGTFQLMHNLINRRGYAVEYYTDAGTPGYTPSPLRVNLQMSSPGDWIIFAIPYPASTTFTVKAEYYPNTVFTAVNSIDDLTHTTYYFDSASSHLYVLMFNENNGQSPSDAFGFKVSDGGNYRQIVITASCGSSCTPPLKGVPKEVPVPRPYRGENYIAVLNGKQSLQTPGSANYGRAYFYFHPNAVSGNRELHYRIFHDLPGTSATLSIKEGNAGSEGSLLNLPVPVGNTASYGIHTLTRREWEALATGKLYLSASVDGKEVIRGQILCDGTCSKPPKSGLNMGDVCNPTYEVQRLYSDGGFVAPGMTGSWNASRVTANLANPDALCGSSSWSLTFTETTAYGVRYDDWQKSPNGLVIDPKFKSLEFFVKSPVKGTRIGVNMYKQDGTPSSTSVDVVTADVDNFVIDNLVWSRVRIDLNRFQLSGKPRTFYVYNHWSYPAATVLIDEFRLSTEVAAPITELADITIPQASVFYKDDVGYPTVPRVGESRQNQMGSASSSSVQIAALLIAIFALFF